MSDSSSSESSLTTDRLGGFTSDDSGYDLIKLALQATYDYYDYFWRGEGRSWNLSARRPNFQNYPVPKTRTRPPRGSRPGRDQPVRGYRRFGRLGLRLERPGAVAEVQQQIEQGYFPVRAALDPLDISISKILGWGGQAVAVLVELTGDDGQREKAVIKCQKPDRSSLASEIRQLDRLSGARHIVGKKEYVPRRFRDPQNDADRALAIQAGILSEAGERLNRNDIYAMELMPHGSVEDLLKKAAKAKAEFRNEDLWKIFQCLLKACIALAYPERWGGNVQDETIPRGDNNRALAIDNAIIHFDISTDNVFIGEFDSTPGPLSHDTIGDLGLAKSFTQAERRDMYNMVAQRRVGKSITFTPEQFTDNWNHLTNAPVVEGEETAGNYDWWTNLYGIGLIMWQVITKTITEAPPQPTRLRSSRAAGDAYSDRGAWTYGGALEDADFDHYDSQLRFLVMWCLVDQPSLRPTLSEAQDMITTALGRDWPALGDDHSNRTSIESLLRDPPPPSNPGDLAPQAPMQPGGGPAQGGPAPAQDVPDPVGPAPTPVEVYAGPNGFFARVSDANGILHELPVHRSSNGQRSFVVMPDDGTRVYVVDASGAGQPAAPVPLSIHAGQQGGGGAGVYVTARRRGGGDAEELVVHTDVATNTRYVEFDGRRTDILDVAGIPPPQA